MDLLTSLTHRLEEIVDDTITTNALVDRLVALGPQEEPLHLTELDNLLKQHYNWLLHLPRVHPFYAVKSNDDECILETAVLLGLGFDCASKRELERMLEYGVDRERIIFAQPAKTIESLEFAGAKKVRTVFDSEAELWKIKQHYPDAEVLLRYKFDSTNSRIVLGSKFGCDPNEEARSLLKLAKDLEINVIGWCFNVGSACSDAEIYYHAIRKGHELSEFAATLGFRFRYLDLGGGFAGDIDTSIAKYAVHINRALEQFFPDASQVTVIAEPGRYYSATAVTNIVPIHGKHAFRSSENPEDIEKMFYYLNDGIAGTFYGVRADNDPVNLVVWKGSEECGPVRRSALYGPTCAEGDRILDDVELPELNVSDFLVFQSHGAYARIYATRFNGFCLPKSVVFIRKSSWELLEALVKTEGKTRDVILGSKYLQQNNRIQRLKYE